MNIIIKSIFFFLLSGIIFSCANIVAPTGGPKDITPPVVKKSKPLNFAKNFKGKRIDIYFDEYIQLRDLNKKLVISPPMAEKPEIISFGKNIRILFTQNLIDSTTYTLNFSDAIVDNNEGNPIPQYEFVFSTGNILDSLTLTGQIYDAFTNQPVEDAFAMLYDNLSDSAPLKKEPFYVSKTDKKGLFTINHIKLDTFRLFILKDLNLNYIYDSEDELIGFADSLVTYHLIVENIKDSSSSDSSKMISSIKYSIPNLNLPLFKEEIKTQYIKNNDRPERQKILLNFNRPIYDTVMISPVYFSVNPDWLILEKFRNNDTICYWITDSTVYKLDTFNIAIKYKTLDSGDHFKYKIDTVFMRFKEKKEVKKFRKPKKSEEKAIVQEMLELKTSVVDKGKLELGSDIQLEPVHPVIYFDESKIHLFQIIDSIETPKDFRLEKDTFLLRRFNIHSNWTEESNYKLFIEPSAFKDLYGLNNDTLLIRFTTPRLDSYGNLILKLSGVNSTSIIQLLNSKSELIREEIVESDQNITFQFLKPQAYKVKIIFDDNKNHKWDTGNYLKSTQPEKVKFYPDDINIRANWDVEVELKIPE